MQRLIMHIDMNSYFASVEQQDNLAWRGLPVGVCEHLGGIIIAASVEAKRYGIKTGTPVWEAKKIYPKIILTPTHPDRYRFYTGRFLKVLAAYTEKIEKYSIDEAFIDVTKFCNVVKSNSLGEWKVVDPFVEAELLAKEIKRRITSEVGDWLKVSIGIAWNKLVAKIASDMQKPDGLVVVRPHEKEPLYQKLKLTDIPGISYRQESNLNDLGIKTLRDLKNYPKSKLVARFGIGGYHLHSMGQLEGSWKEGFGEDEPIKSMGHMYTVAKEHRRPGIVIPVLYKLSEMVGARMRVNGLSGSVLHVSIQTVNNQWIGKSKKLGVYINDGRDIFLEAKAILQTLHQKEFNQLSVKFVGVTVAGLQEEVNQKSLFPFYEKKKRVVKALDKINDKYEDFTIARVPAFLARDIIRDSVGFGRMKEFKTVGNFKRAK